MDNMYKPKNNPFQDVEEYVQVDFSNYEAPIHAFINEQYMNYMKSVSDSVKDAVYNQVIGIGVDVDKAELLKALSYDRYQYSKGYSDGVKASSPKWTSFADSLPKKPGKYLVYSKVGTMYTSNFDPNVFRR